MREERLPRPARSVASTCAWLCGVLAALAACGDIGEPPSTPARFTDSAGVAIVTNPPAGATYATLTPEPVLSIGAVDGPAEVLFGRIASVALDGAGNFIVADGQAGEIRMFDPGGAHLRTYGRAGEGPGEFRALAGAWPETGSVIVAVDSRLDRITRFGPEGELLTTATFQGPGEQPMIRPIRPAGPDVFLSRVQSLLPISPQSASSLEDVLESISDPLGSRLEYLVRHDLSGVLIDTVATVPSQATVTSGQGSGADMSIQIMRVPFSPAAAATASSDGRVAVTTGRSYEFSLHDPAGTLESVVRIAEEPPVRTDAHLEAWVRGSVRGHEPMDDAQVEAAVRRYEEMPLPERLPAWNSLLIADTGEIWARRFAIRGAETVPWDVFSTDGSLLGQVAVPASLRIQHIGEGRLTAVFTDDLGIQRVQMYELR